MGGEVRKRSVYRAINIKPPLRISEIQIFSHLLLFSKNLGLFFTAFISLKKFSACGGLLLFSIFLSSNFDL